MDKKQGEEYLNKAKDAYDKYQDSQNNENKEEKGGLADKAKDAFNKLSGDNK